VPTKKQQQITDTVADVIKTKQHRNRPDLQKFGEENTLPGDNSRYLRYAMASWDLQPINISDPVQVQNRIQQYFQYCIDNDRKPNMIGMANWLGVDRKTVNNWKSGDYRTETHLPVIKKAIDVLEELWVDYMMNGKVNPGSGIFLGKNMFQYKDVADVVITPNTPYQQGEIQDVNNVVQSLPDPEEKTEE